MKVVINTCFGGFSLSPKAIKWIAEKEGRECYFFKGIGANKYDRADELGDRTLFFSAFDIPNPSEVLGDKDWFSMSLPQRKAHNKLYEKHSLKSRYDSDERADPLLIQCVEALGEEANGACAQLSIVEIPDGIEWEISEYDGNESVEEKHRSWR